MAWILIIPLLLLGLLCGILVNYLADVLPIKRKLTTPFCHACEMPIDYINYIFFPGICPRCGAKRKLRTVIVDGIYSLLTVYLWFFPSPRMNFWAGLLLWIYFGLVIIIDLEHRLILHPVSIFGVVLGLWFGVWMHGWISTILGGLLGFLIMLVLYYLGILLFNKIIKKRSIEESGDDEQPVEEALGFGDVNLSGVIGLLLGWPGIVAGVTFTIFLAGGFSLLYLIVMVINKKYQAYMSIPYGPFIVFGAALLLFFVK